MRRSSPQELLRIVKCKQRLRDYNERRPEHLRHSDEQIDRRARKAVRDGLVNDRGYIINVEKKR